MYKLDIFLEVQEGLSSGHLTYLIDRPDISSLKLFSHSTPQYRDLCGSILSTPRSILTPQAFAAHASRSDRALRLRFWLSFWLLLPQPPTDTIG